VTVRLRHDVAESVATSPDARWTCALVNNMPDGAFDATERQFLGILDAGSGENVLEVRRFTMGGVPRGERTTARIGEEYSPLTDIYVDPPDLLLVTGSNPIETDIRDELYWDDLVELLTWSRKYVPTTVLSCLSAHAALTVFDGIERVRLPAKCTGVFPQDVDVNHPLARGIEREILLPHSRQNSVRREAMIDAGYAIVVQSDDVGWGVASREENGRQLVLVQGHPEYDRSSLLREYHRDVARYVHHERDDLPILPLHCAAPPDWAMLEESHHNIINGQRDAALVDTYPFDEVGERAPWPWRDTAQQFYANVLANMSEVD
jgi:homoserine O-succinyltransferase/O-acetyltransferase